MCSLVWLQQGLVAWLVISVLSCPFFTFVTALSRGKLHVPSFLYPVPIRKTRAGLQFTCAAPTLGVNTFGLRDVWVCNSDGYVGQVCVLSLVQPDEPVVQSCNGVCNSRILCIASIPTMPYVYQCFYSCTRRGKSILTTRVTDMQVRHNFSARHNQLPAKPPCRQ
jgi:hypothetical protein